MNRKEFITRIALTSLSLPFMKLDTLGKIVDQSTSTKKMPLLFVGHGNPMNAILDNSFSQKWKSLGKELPIPKAILVVSAHWITNKSTKVTAMASPKTIHDFRGFPDELFQQQYAAPGSPEWSKETIDLVETTTITEDFEWGLDHGTWSILKPMFPKATIPVYQISLDYTQPTLFHYQLGRELEALRSKGVLIIGSGNIVHNLSALNSTSTPPSWAEDFDEKMKQFINQRDFQSVVDFQKLGTIAKQAQPTYDHFLPLLYVLGATSKKDNISYFNNGFDMGSISMRSLLITEN